MHLPEKLRSLRRAEIHKDNAGVGMGEHCLGARCVGNRKTVAVWQGALQFRKKGGRGADDDQ